MDWEEKLSRGKEPLLARTLELGGSPAGLAEAIGALDECDLDEDQAMALVTVLSHSPEARQKANPWLKDTRAHRWLGRLLQVPHRQPLVVLDTLQKRAHRLLVWGLPVAHVAGRIQGPFGPSWSSRDLARPRFSVSPFRGGPGRVESLSLRCPAARRQSADVP